MTLIVCTRFREESEGMEPGWTMMGDDIGLRPARRCYAPELRAGGWGDRPPPSSPLSSTEKTGKWGRTAFQPELSDKQSFGTSKSGNF